MCDEYETSCPACEERLALTERGKKQFVVLRCPSCHTHLQVAETTPLTLRSFRPHGLEWINANGRIV